MTFCKLWPCERVGVKPDSALPHGYIFPAGYDAGSMKELALMAGWNDVFRPVNGLLGVVLVFAFADTASGRYRSFDGYRCARSRP
jgi:hypothetical protein